MSGLSFGMVFNSQPTFSTSSTFSEGIDNLVLCDKDRTPRKVPGQGSLERRNLEVNRKRVKVVKPSTKTSFATTEIRGTYTPPFHVELFRNDQHRMRIVVDSENEVDLMVQSRHIRDIIVLVIRGLAQRFNSTSLNSLLKIET
ncbi:hypothetical protein C5167_036601 [Papaver somniferum]|uniref:AIR9 PH-like domain-containing protein n=1 Tax=Papaver somniferum TaxID=3469 RepID=A0A4Y7I438_PAPSO|nr:hypothetical protein C5167_036601 [Papaver somniferum]